MAHCICCAIGIDAAGNRLIAAGHNTPFRPPMHTLIRLDAPAGRLDALNEGALDRLAAQPDLSPNDHGTRRDLFATPRQRKRLDPVPGCGKAQPHFFARKNIPGDRGRAP